MSDHYYYNLCYTNHTNQLQPARLSETTTGPIIKYCDQYYVSIIRFTIPMQHIPIFVFENNTYSVTLSIGGNNYQTFLTYISQSTDPDRSIWSYQNFIDSINNALTASFTALQAANPGITATSAPYMTFNVTTQLCSLSGQTALVTDGITIWFNHGLYSFFENFDAYIDRTFAVTAGKNVRLKLKDNKNNVVANVITITQEYPNMGLWYQARSIVLTTGMIPVEKEFVTLDATKYDSHGHASLCVLTDFELDLSNGSQIRGLVQYVANPYRLIDLKSQTDLNTIDINVYWRDSKNVLRPLYISPDECITIKLAFIRKSNLLDK